MGGEAARLREAVHLGVDGQEFVVRARSGERGVYDFDWLNGPSGYGFSSATYDGAAMDVDALRESVREFLAGQDETDDEDETGQESARGAGGAQGESDV